MTRSLLDAGPRSAYPQAIDLDGEAARSGRGSKCGALGVRVSYVYAYSSVPGLAPQLMELSPHVEDLLGYSLREWEGDPFLWQRLLHPEDARWVLAATRTSLDRGPYDVTYRMVSADARLLWIHDFARVDASIGGTLEIWRGSWTVVPEPVDRTPF